MIDKVLVTRKASLILKDLALLEPMAAMSVDSYLEDPIQEALAERYLERIIGRAIDINFHLVTELGHPPPKDYFESFVELGRLKVLRPELARELAQAAGLRNRIVHEYDEIDERKVYEGVRFALKDIPLFLKAVQTFLDSLPK